MRLDAVLQGLWMVAGTGRLGGTGWDCELERWVCGRAPQIPPFSSWAQGQMVWGSLGGSPELPEQQEAVGEGGRHGCSCGGARGWPIEPLHGGGGQVGVLVLELAIESEASLLTVGCKHGGDGVRFGEGGVGCHSLAGRGARGELRVSTSLVGAQHLPGMLRMAPGTWTESDPPALPSPPHAAAWACFLLLFP